MRCIVISTLFLISGFVSAQDGYWQQKVDYKIEVSLDDSLQQLDANVEMVYHNKSPDTLSFIIMHLWPNAYRSPKTALGKQLTRSGNTRMQTSGPEDLGYIDSLAFEIDGEPCVWDYDDEHIDICTLLLESPITPGRSIKISTPFKVKLPTGRISRLGHIGQSYQITQWYPKPAVYDREGWHGMPYLNQGEFYSEYGSFDVSITLPENYTVGATGDLQTEKEVGRLKGLVKSTRAWIDSLEQDTLWKEIKISEDFPESSTHTKTLRYTQDRVHDFAWFADKRYRVLNGKVELPGSGDSVTVWTMFTDREAKLWSQSIEYMHDAVYYYSLWNGDYPYRQATAVDGTISAGGGMEYPNVTVIGTSGDPLGLETVIMHEVGHNWFYGILGSNERRYAWMDEGLNSYNELRYLERKYPNSYLLTGNSDSNILVQFAGLDRYGAHDVHYLSYMLSARQNSDQPMNLSSEKYVPLNYGTVVYSKSAVWFNYLKHYLGEEKMDEAMHAYFNKWKFKHPYPSDFAEVMRSTSGKQLNWLFDKGIDSTAKIDYAVSRIKKRGEGHKVILKNKGGVDGPIPVAFYNGDSEVSRSWVEGSHGKIELDVTEGANSVVIDPDEVVPEIRRHNNRADVQGWGKRLEPIEIKLLGQLEDPTRSEILWTPLATASVPGGFMPGVAIYNSFVPVSRLNWLIAPMFSTKAVDVSGMGEVYYSIMPQGSLFQTIDIGVSGRRFVRDNLFFYDPVEHLSFFRVSPYVRFDLRPYQSTGNWNDEFTVRSIIVGSESIIPSSMKKRIDSEVLTRVDYDLSYKHPNYGTKAGVRFEMHEEFLRSSIEVVNILEADKILKLRSRVFVGGFLSNNSTDPRFNYRMEGQTQWNDYAYDHYFMDRSMVSELLNRQMTESHGGFKIPTAVGSSSQGLFAYNAELFISKFPIGIFSDIGFSFDGDALGDAGICIAGKRRFFGLYLPLVYTDNIAQEISANGWGFLDLIRFQLNVNVLNPFELRRNISM